MKLTYEPKYSPPARIVRWARVALALSGIVFVPSGLLLVNLQEVRGVSAGLFLVGYHVDFLRPLTRPVPVIGLDLIQICVLASLVIGTASLVITGAVARRGRGQPREPTA